MAVLPRIAGGIDPLVRLLALAIVLASLLPVGAAHRPIAEAWLRPAIPAPITATESVGSAIVVSSGG